MAVESIRVLKRQEGTKTIDGYDLEIYYRIITDDYYDSAREVLSWFPVGCPQQAYIGSLPKEALDKDLAPQLYYFPWPQEPCEEYELPFEYPDSEMYKDTVLVNASIESREFENDSDRSQWVVRCTYLDAAMTEGFGSPPRILPRYTYNEVPLQGATYRGQFNREKDSQGNMTWQARSTSSKGGLPLSGKTGQVISPINSAGRPFTNPAMTTTATAAFDVEWFSYTYLDFSEAIGRTNANNYVLKAYDRPVDMNASNIPNLDKPYLIFCKAFTEKTLLVADVQTTQIRWGGRNNYRYTVTLEYQPENKHNAYILDSGYSFLMQAGDKTASGGEAEEEDPDKTSSTDTQVATGRDGVASSGESLLNGEGQKLQRTEGQSGAGLPPAVFLKYEFRDTVQFPSYKEITETNMYHTFNIDAKCPLMMDGGNRYQVGNPDSSWRCGFPNDSRY